jgi:F-type H+-transporting ATPase subunit b
MNINWFTVIAQVINFLILVWLLKKYLYKPILKAVDDREKLIASQLDDAKAKKAEAEQEQDEFKKKNDDFDQAKKALMDKAIAETKQEREQLLEEARNEAKALGAKLEKASKDAQKQLNSTIAQKTQQQVFVIARKALTDLASQSLEEQLVNVFVKRLEALKGEEKKEFITAFKENTTPLIVRSAFDLPTPQQTEINEAVSKLLGTEIEFEYKTEPELISGIELTANGYKLAWSITEYLNSLEKNILGAVEEKSTPESEEK